MAPIASRDPSAPMLAVGGCPFPQGEMPPPVALPTALGENQMVAAVPGGCPFRQAPTVTPPPTDANRSNGLTNLIAPTPPVAAVREAVTTADVPPLTATQLAAFQQAYIKALQEQKEIMAQAARQGGLSGAAGGAARVSSAPAAAQGAQPQQKQPQGQPVSRAPARPQAAQPPHRQLPSNGAARAATATKLESCCNGASAPAASAPAGASSSAASADGEPSAGDDDEDTSEGLVLATSCAHGPLVTHPNLSSASGMLVSVFPSSHESWLYVLMAGEFGVPFDIGMSAKGVIYGRLQFRAKMQQWALLRVEPSEWKAVCLETLIPATVHAWKLPMPPKGDARWICFPYLTKEPDSSLNLPHLLSIGCYPLDVKPNVSPIMLQARLPMPEATVQRDVKAIGARPNKKDAPKSARKRPQKAQGGTPLAPGMASAFGKGAGGSSAAGLAPAGAAVSSAAPGAGSGNPAKRARGQVGPQGQAFDPRLVPRPGGDGRPDQAMGAYNPGAGSDAAMRQLLQSLGMMHSRAQQQAGQHPGQSQAGGSSGAPLPPSRSTLELLQLLEGAAKTIVQQQQANGQQGGLQASGDLALPLHDSASVASLLGLLRSDSMQQSLAALESQRAESVQPGSSELNLAALVRAASSTDMASSNGNAPHNGMPPPQFTPWSGRNAPRAATNNLSGAPSIEDLYELQALAGSFKESPSVTSLIDLVRSR